MNFEQWLESLGIDVSTLTDAAKAELKTKFDASQSSGGTFTQEQVNRMMADHKRTLQTENQRLQQQAQTQQNQITQLTERLDQMAVGNPPAKKPKDDPETQGRIELLQRQHTQEKTALQGQVDELTKRLDKEVLKRREVERDKLLSEALSSAQCIDITAGTRYFLPQIKFSDEFDDWRFTTKAGNPVTITEGVVAELPDFLKPASVRNGGSGTTTGNAKNAVQKKRFSEAKDKLEKLEAQARQSGKQHDLLAFQRQKKVVAELEKEQ